MLKNILTDISNPRLDILIIYKENNSIADELFKYFKSKNLMCCVFSSNIETNHYYSKDLINNTITDEILLDFIKKSYIVICIDLDYNCDYFNQMNKIIFKNKKIIFNDYSSTYIDSDIINKEYEFNNHDLEFIYNLIIIKLFKKNYKIVAAISHMNEKTLNLCLDSIKNQSIPMEDIKVFQGLTPM